MAKNNKIDKRIGPKVRQTQIPKGAPSIISPLEEQVKALSTSLNTGITALFFGDKNSGADPKKATNAIKNHATRTILGDKNSIYFELSSIKSKLPSKNTLNEIKTASIAINKAFETNSDLFNLLNYLKYLEPSDDSKKYEGIVKFAIEGLDEKSIDKLKELLKLGENKNNDLIPFLTDLYTLLQQFGSLDSNASNGIKNIYMALCQITLITPLLQSIFIADKSTPSVSIIENFSKKIIALFEGIKEIEGLDKSKIKELNSSIWFLAKLIPQTILLSTLIGKKGDKINKLNEIVGTNHEFGLSQLFYEVKSLESIADGQAQKLGFSLNVLNRIIYRMADLSDIYLKNKNQINKFTDSMNQKLGSKGEISQLFSNLENISSVDIASQDQIFNNMDILKNIIETLNNISGKYNNENTINLVNNLSALLKANKGQDLYKIFKKIHELSDDKYKDDANKLLKSVAHISGIINTFEKIKITDKTSLNADQLNQLFSGKNEKDLKNSLKGIFKSIDSIDLPSNEKFQNINNTLKALGETLGVFTEIAKNSKDSKKLKENIMEYLKAIEESYKEMKERFEQIVEMESLAKKVQAANTEIAKANESNNKAIVQTVKNEKQIKKANITMKDMAAFMLISATVLIIGALIVLIGGGKFIKAAIEFGITLMIFETLVLAPALMFAAIKSLAMPSLEEFSSFVIACTFTMVIGATFILLGGGKLVKAAFQFGIALMGFETLILAPMLVFAAIKSGVIPSLKQFTWFVVTCTFVMLLGGLFVGISNGKLLKNALSFGMYLMAFEAMVVAPMILFNLVGDSVEKSLSKFTGFIIASTFVMVLGSVFMMSKNLVNGALRFTGLLALFEIATITPFLLFALVKPTVVNGLKDFTNLVIASTFCLVLGAIFMQSKKLVKGAIEFTKLLMIFETGILLPLFVLSLAKPIVDRGIREFGILIMASTFCLVLGAVFMQSKKLVQGAKDFIWLMLEFTIGMVAPFFLFSLIQRRINKAIIEFTIFIAASTFCLVLGATFMKIIGAKPVEDFALLLGLFVLSMAVIIKIISSIINEKVLAEIGAFGTFILLSSIALTIGALFIKKYGAASVITYGIILGIFVRAMGGVMIGLSWAFKAVGGELIAIAQMSALGSFLLLSTAAIALGTIIVDKYGIVKPLLYAGLLVGYIGLMGAVFAGLLLLSPFIAPGAVVATLMGAALLTLTGSLMLINLLFKFDPKGKLIKENINTLDSVLDSVKGTFAFLGLLSPFIVPGAIAAAAMGAALLILGGSLGLINLIIGKQGSKIKQNIITLNELLGWDYLGGTFTILGLLSIPIAAGSVVGIAMAASISILGGALALVNLMINPIKDELIGNLKLLQDAIIQIGIISGELILLSIPLTLAIAIMGPLNLVCLGLTTSTLMIATSIKKMVEIGDISDKTEMIVNNIQAFVDIPDKVSFGGIIGMLKKIASIEAITMLSTPLALTMKVIAESIADIASLKVANKWDKKGNAIGYRQLKDKDFDLAINNIGRILTTMADAFVKTWEGDGTKKGLNEFAKDKNGALWMTLSFSKQVGQVIKGIAEGVGTMAKMQIATSWDKNGNPISFRQLKQKDFDLASEGVSKVLTHMAGTIIGVYALGGELGIKYNNGKNLFDSISGGLFSDDEPSPFINTLEASLKISELIGNIGEAVGNISKMQIPIAWDEKGKAVRFRTLKPADFIKAGNNISTILTTIITSLGELYAKGATEELGGSGNKNIFDAVSGGLFTDDKPSPIISVIEASLKISELISNIGKGIKDIATLQIADRWNEKGVATHYVPLTKEDFVKAGDAIGDILTCTLTALTSNEKLWNAPEQAKQVFEAVQPISDLISGMAEGIVKMATGQIAIGWDQKTGKPNKFRKITLAEYLEAGIVIGSIVSFMTRTLLNVATQDSKDGKCLMSIFEGDDFKKIIEAISGTGELISNIADSVIKIGQALVPNEWDKDGKPIHYTKIDLKSARENLKNTISEILMATIKSVIDVYYGNGMPNNQGIQFMIGDTENSPFLLATQGISTIMQTISTVVDAIVKLGTAQIPDAWDKNGKAIHFKPISVDNTIKNIKTIFKGKNGKDGLLTVLCSEIKNISKDYFEGNDDISEKLAITSSGISTIIQMVSNAADLLIKVGSMTVPTGFDKDGKATGYKKLEGNIIDNVRANITTIITSLFMAMDNALNTTIGATPLVNSSLMSTNGEKPELLVKVQTSVENIIEVVNSVLSNISELIGQESSINKIMNYKGVAKPKNSELTLGLFKDIYVIMDNLNNLSKVFSTENNTEGNVISNLNSVIIDKEIIKNIDNKLSLISSLITSIIDNYVDIKNTFEENNKQLLSILIDNKGNVNKDIVNKINGIIEIFNEVAIKTSNNTINIDELNKKSSNIKRLSQLITNLSILLINNFISLKEEINELDKLGKLEVIVNHIKSSFNLLNNFYFNEENGFISIINTLSQNLNEEINTNAIKLPLYLMNISLLSTQLLSAISIITSSYKTNQKLIEEFIKENKISSNIVDIINDIIKINNDINIDGLKENNLDLIKNPINSFINFIGNENTGFIQNISSLINKLKLNETIINYKDKEENKLSYILEPIIADMIKVTNLMSEINGTTNDISSFGMINIANNNNILQSVRQFKESIECLIDSINKSKEIEKILVDNLKINLKSIAELFSIEIPLDRFGKTNIGVMNQSLDDFISIALKFDYNAFANVSALGMSIKTVYSVTSSQKGTKIFKDNTETLSKYVKAINNIDLRKLNPLVELTKELNKLAARMGNLDGLTTAISEKLAATLNELCEKLEESRYTMETADKIQERRYRLITETVGKVQQIMAQPFNVEIAQSQSSSSMDSNSGPSELEEGKDYSYDDMKNMGYNMSESEFNDAAGKDKKLNLTEAQDYARKNTNYKDVFKYKKYKLS